MAFLYARKCRDSSRKTTVFLSVFCISRRSWEFFHAEDNKRSRAVQPPKTTLFKTKGRRCGNGGISHRQDARLHGHVKSSSAQHGIIPESERASVAHAVLPDNWDYTTKGLARICKDGVDSICAAVRELEEHGYVIRERVRGANGQLGSIEYTILEQPAEPSPERENPVQVNPILENPVLGKPEQGIPAQSNTDLSITELIVDTVCSARKTIRIAGDDYPAEVVKSRFLKLDSSHVQYVIDCMKNNTTYVRNIKKYLLAALYNAPATINSYYSSLVQHDLYGGGERGG